jgi:hypothetical protein
MKILNFTVLACFAFSLSASGQNDLEKVKEVYPYALMSDASYSMKSFPIDGYTRLEREEIPTEWQKEFQTKNNSVNDSSLAFSAMVFKKTTDSKDLVVAFKGGELRSFIAPDKFFFSNLRKFISNIATVLYMKLTVVDSAPAHFDRALDLIEALEAQCPECNITVTGSSLGGAVAQYVGLMKSYKTYIFNSLQISGASLKNVQQHNPIALANAEKLVNVISIEGEWISDKDSYLNTALSRPKTYLGDEFIIPRSKKHSIQHTTDAILASLKKMLESSETATAQ